MPQDKGLGKLQIDLPASSGVRIFGDAVAILSNVVVVPPVQVGGGRGGIQRVVWAAKETAIDIFLDYFTFSSLVHSVASRAAGRGRSMKGSQRGLLDASGFWLLAAGWIERTTSGELPREGKSLQRHYQRTVRGWKARYPQRPLSLPRPHLSKLKLHRASRPTCSEHAILLQRGVA
jgi:hypothetical protein